MTKQSNLVKDIVNKKVSTRQLTLKQRKFVEAYCRNGENATAAAKEAGYAATKDADFYNIASQTLKKESIQEAIKAEKSRIAAEARKTEAKTGKRHLTAAEVLQELTDIATNPEQRTADRLKALDSLAKYHALYTEKIVQQVDYATIIAESRSRLQSTDTADTQPITGLSITH